MQKAPHHAERTTEPLKSTLCIVWWSVDGRLVNVDYTLTSMSWIEVWETPQSTIIHHSKRVSKSRWRDMFDYTVSAAMKIELILMHHWLFSIWSAVFSYFYMPFVWDVRRFSNHVIAIIVIGNTSNRHFVLPCITPFQWLFTMGKSAGGGWFYPTTCETYAKE